MEKGRFTVLKGLQIPTYNPDVPSRPLKYPSDIACPDKEVVFMRKNSDPIVTSPVANTIEFPLSPKNDSLATLTRDSG